MIKEERRKICQFIRVMTGIRNMGYTLESAILDIVDNSIVAGAKKVNIIIQAEDKTLKQSIRKNHY